MLVTFAVLAALAALLIPGVNRAINSAKATKCLGKLRTLGVAVHAYIGEHNDFLPYRAEDANWMYNLGPYLGVLPTKKSGNLPMTDAFLCPDDPSKEPRQHRTYRFHQSFPSPGGASAYGRSNYTPTRYREIVSPATHGMIFCVAYSGPRPLDLWRFDEAIWKKAPDASNDPVTSLFPRPHYRGNAMNVLFSDGRAGVVNFPVPSTVWHFDGR